MVACFRIGAVVLPCNEQLRAKAPKLRLAATTPRLILADERNLDELHSAAPDVPVLTIPDEALFENADPAPPA
ncbi:AMP-dependent synthetase, partial [Lacticaseibacillus rhamnosus]